MKVIPRPNDSEVGVGRLELPRPYGQQILNLQRLPIPPYPQAQMLLTSILTVTNIT
jgi:hypothetical protein